MDIQFPLEKRWNVPTLNAKGAKIISDGWTGYSFLSSSGFQHEVSPKSDKDKHLPHFHRVISNLKTWLKGTYHGGMQPKHFPAYLNEFTFRFNRRFLPGKGFNRALGLATELESPTYQELYNAGELGGWRHPVEKATAETKPL